jgi:hypothetical protein
MIMTQKTLIIMFFTAWMLMGGFLPPVALRAQEIDFSASVDRTSLSLQEQLILSVTVRGDMAGVPEPSLPSIPGFTVLSRSQSQSIEIVNFQTSASLIFQYILQPQKTGSFTIRPVTLNYNGREYSTDPIKIQVTRESAGPINPPPQTFTMPTMPPVHRPPGRPSRPGSHRPPMIPSFSFPFDEPMGKIMAFATTDKKSAVVNELVVLTIAFCYPAEVSVEHRVIPPANRGFLIEEVAPVSRTSTTIKGTQYAIDEHKYVLIPINSGTLTIESASVNYQVRDIFAGGSDTIKTDPIDIKISSLPKAGAPRDYTNGVGSFDISAKVEPLETPMDEPVTLTYTVSGEGNISTLELQKISDIPHFKKFDTTENHVYSTKGSGITGEKTFKTVLIPQKMGELTIPSLVFPYYDPQKKDYRQASTAPLTLKVTAPTHKGGASPAPSAGSTGPDSRTSDIRYIKSAMSARPGTSKPLYRNALFLSLQALPLLVIGALLIQGKRKEHMERNPLGIRKSRAYAAFRKTLDSARRELKGKNFASFYSTAQKAVTDYLKDKFAIPGTGLSISQLNSLLEEKQFPGDRIKELEAIMTTCERARFAPSGLQESECIETLKSLQTLVSILEKKRNDSR